MTVIHQCDRCHVQDKAPTLWRRVELPQDNATKPTREMDLCLSCLKDLHRWSLPQPQEAKP